MSISKEKIRFTYEDYLHLPDDGKRYQVIEGEVYMVPAPTPYHQDVLRKLLILLSEFVEEHVPRKAYCAPCDVVLSQENIVQPDIFFICKEREHIVTEGNIRGAPDLVVEIILIAPHNDTEVRCHSSYERYRDSTRNYAKDYTFARA